MKRCPQCEFTFDDNQHFCDFDGAELSAVIERPLSSPQFSTPRAILPSFILRFIRSNFSLGVLALAGIVLSAVLVGYYSASEVESKGETRDFVTGAAPKDSVASFVPEPRESAASPVYSDQTPVQASPQTNDKTMTPDTVTKGRATRAARDSSSLTSSTVTRRAAAFRSRTRFRSSTHKLEVVRRRFAQPENAVKPAVDSSNKALPARNLKRQESSEQITQQRSADGMGNSARVADGQPGPAGRESAAGKASENAPQKKESKVIAMLKKTGRTLSKPFKFLGHNTWSVQSIPLKTDHNNDHRN